MKKKLVIPSLGLLTVVAFASALLFLAPAPESTARPPADCVGSFLTAERWGHGGTCSVASQDLFDQVWALAEQRCGVNNVCNWALVITGQCSGPDGDKMMDGQLQHGCLEDEILF